jgi:hypothetical protein
MIAATRLIELMHCVLIMEEHSIIENDFAVHSCSLLLQYSVFLTSCCCLLDSNCHLCCCDVLRLRNDSMCAGQEANSSSS